MFWESVYRKHGSSLNVDDGGRAVELDHTAYQVLILGDDVHAVQVVDTQLDKHEVDVVVDVLLCTRPSVLRSPCRQGISLGRQLFIASLTKAPGKVSCANTALCAVHEAVTAAIGERSVQPVVHEHMEVFVRVQRVCAVCVAIVARDTVGLVRGVSKMGCAVIWR